jgi:DNA helicase II / ATP-dependent DNA helicase PcrA
MVSVVVVFKGLRLCTVSTDPFKGRDIVNDLNFYNQYEVTAAERNQIRKDLEKMFKTLNLRTLYKEFYAWLGKPEMLKMQKGSRYEYADVYPLVYLKISLEGVQGYHDVKHLVIDEMQDYTPLQYSILSRLFPANKTILGDVNQSVNPYGYSDTDAIGRVFPNAETVNMVKSYRSTIEIVELAQRIRWNEEIEVVERHGEPPVIVGCKSDEEELSEVRKMIDGFLGSSYNSLGIICKTQGQAERLHESLKEHYNQLYLLNSQSTAFVNGIIITTAHMAKGLEFDQVIVPFAGGSNYKSETDRQMLYVACTRAMHRLDLTYTGKRSNYFY